jgi:hypothetical protein
MDGVAMVRDQGAGEAQGLYSPPLHGPCSAGCRREGPVNTARAVEFWKVEAETQNMRRVQMTTDEKKDALKAWYKSQNMSLHGLLEELIYRQKLNALPRISQAVDLLYQEFVDQGKIKAAPTESQKEKA